MNPLECEGCGLRVRFLHSGLCIDCDDLDFDPDHARDLALDN